MNQPWVYIIILNYNNWQDTLECLESILKNSYARYKIVIVDNGSADHSVFYILKWLHKELAVWIHPDHPMKQYSFPPSKRKISYSRYQIDQNNIENLFKISESEISSQLKSTVFILESPENLGFAAGNNLGIEFVLSLGDYQYVWILNNDTVITTETLSHLVRKSQQDPMLGIVGSKLLRYHSPQKTEGIGGGVNKFTARTFHLKDDNEMEQITYIPGTSMLLTKECLEKIGFMPEEYFLYYEDTDYCLKAKKSGFHLGVSLDSCVFHKLGRSSNTLIKDYYDARNILLFAYKYLRSYLPVVLVSYLYRIVLPKIIRFQLKRLRIVGTAFYHFLSGKSGKIS
jgi:GT2 family glycosyltransferase